ncbi:BQ5605_C020g09152 [Microbotryum silenes-dioicae]|uniref:BQ5605_C020g09152 protein n=1 Tax=Microbotryum silenes-dioicae TaxID=796604 RepID=A0A2X0MJW0_9BASI|nr:BQ5605_C020g09152 [Microbotryum silenes-dioicae]
MGALCCKPEAVDFDGPVDLYHFYLLRSVGKGAFGKVRVVQHKQTKALYALKYINKARISKQRAVNNIIQERRLLEEIDSPFVCNLRFAFQDDENLFMVLDLMLGGDLRFHLDRLGAMKEEVVKFYVAEMALALGDLHRRGIVHRDLKPDNILLDERGHAHLTDFNIAVHYTEERALTSVAGSMAYMAPEVLAKRGYFSTVDWWSLGVVAYELLFGKRPYRGKTNSSLTTAIMRDQIRFPENAGEILSQDGMACIRGLLQRDTRKRLGCKHTGGLEALKRHPWFKDYDWDVIEKKEATPPFEPDSRKANFDATHELEELLLEDNPLKARKRNPNLDVTAMSADYRTMEQNFTPYDFTRQPRKSWFVTDEKMTAAAGGAAASSSKPTAAADLSPASLSVHSQAVKLESQPLSDVSVEPASSHLGSFLEPSTAGSGRQSFEMQSTGTGSALAAAASVAANAPSDPTRRIDSEVHGSSLEASTSAGSTSAGSTSAGSNSGTIGLSPVRASSSGKALDLNPVLESAPSSPRTG